MKTIQINNKHYQECDVVMLATDKESKLCFVVNTENSTLTLFEDDMEKAKRFFPQHLYILSTEEIKESDWGISTLNEIIKFNKNYDAKFYKKIIATTDISLGYEESIYDPRSKTGGKWISLPQIPQLFIEHYITEYNKGNVITKVLVECEEIKSATYEPCVKWSLIKINQNNEIAVLREIFNSTKEKEETLEEAAKQCLKDNGLPVAGDFSEGYIVGAVTGAKWQAERMYSKEDLKEAYFAAIKSTNEGWNGEYARGVEPNIEEIFSEDFNEWFEQFKKK